jgi:hypothetical protein
LILHLCCHCEERSDEAISIKVAQGIVGYADLALGDRVEPVLEALIRAAGRRLSGVRYSVSATRGGRPDND